MDIFLEALTSFLTIGTTVKIKEGSYLDSFMYTGAGSAGSALVKLTQQIINCIIYAQVMCRFLMEYLESSLNLYLRIQEKS